MTSHDWGLRSGGDLPDPRNQIAFLTPEVGLYAESD